MVVTDIATCIMTAKIIRAQNSDNNDEEILIPCISFTHILNSGHDSNFPRLPHIALLSVVARGSIPTTLASTPQDLYSHMVNCTPHYLESSEIDREPKVRVRLGETPTTNVTYNEILSGYIFKTKSLASSTAERSEAFLVYV